MVLKLKIIDRTCSNKQTFLSCTRKNKVWKRKQKWLFYKVYTVPQHLMVIYHHIVDDKRKNLNANGP